MKLRKIYLAIPYRGIGEPNSYEQATKAAGQIISLGGYNVFSPITHYHPQVIDNNLKSDWETWKKYVYQYIDWADEIWVLIPNEGANKIYESEGVNGEIEYGKLNNKPIRFVSLVEEGIVMYLINQI